MTGPSSPEASAGTRPLMEVGSSSSDASVVQVSFPGAQTSVLESLNRQREDGSLCDLSIHVQGQVFKAHRCVLAASSPYFHDQVLLKNMSTVSIPAVMDPLAFESVLSCAYTGRLRMLRDDIVNYLTVGSVLQMWHIVDKCTELLKESRAPPCPPPLRGPAAGRGVQEGAGGGERSTNPGCSSSNASRAAGGTSGVSPRRAGESNDPQQAANPPNQPLVTESQSPSSTNYFSPRDGSGFGGGGAAAAGEEALLIEEEEEDMEEEEEEVYHQRKRGRGGGSGRRKKMSSVSEQEVGVSDSFGVSSYQDGEDAAMPLQKRPTYSQPSIMPRKQWVVVKTERTEDDDLIVVSEEEEGGEDEEEEEEREMELAGREATSTSPTLGVFQLSWGVELRATWTQVDFCQSSEDFFKFEGSLMEQTLAQHLQDSAAGQNQKPSRVGPAGQVQNASSARAQLFHWTCRGTRNPPVQPGLWTPPGLCDLSAGVAGGVMGGGASFKSSNLEHGVVHLQGGLGVDGSDSGGVGGGGGGGAGGSAKVFMCHCGKSFTHKSMRDRHINMHLDLRPFHCPVCSKKFKMKHHLTEHMKTHTGLKPRKKPGRDARRRDEGRELQLSSTAQEAPSNMAAGGLLGVPSQSPGQDEGPGMFGLGLSQRR
ncbi:hypothetical protein OJAV_G00110930 [Oryzias javanicus]|uniref:BTB domain-containing protein n=1 Tax=Oryzias javanicus TaxID=123683 RepID=A0A3S2P531_ORYJA|nr:hypothetical protein OJAV_G00110930 [Oryzias javanicus]